MSASVALGVRLLRYVLLIIALGLGALGGISAAIAAGALQWPGYAVEISVEVVTPTWLDEIARTVPVAATMHSSDRLLAAVARDRLAMRWAEVDIRAQAEQMGPLSQVRSQDDINTIAGVLEGSLRGEPALHGATITTVLTGFRSAYEADVAAMHATEALVGLVTDLRAEEVLSLRETLAQAAGTEKDALHMRVATAIDARDYGIAPGTQRPVRATWPPVAYFVAGLGAAVGVCLMLLALRPRQQLATPLHSLASISQALGVEVIGAVPYIPSFSRHSGDADRELPMALREGDDPAAREAFEVLLTNFRFAAPQATPRQVCFVSAVPGEGCAAVAYNFAMAHVRRGLKVAFRFANSEPFLLTSAHGNGAPEFERSPALVLGDSEIDLWVISGPALLADPDARVVAAKADAVVLVLDITVTGRALAIRALSQLRASPVPLIGVVLNRVRRGGLRRAFLDRASVRTARI